ncbi:MAG: hypothetical protein EZS28_045611, partial [Streblomastix strix]
MYETMEVICGLMLVGETGTAKTTYLRALNNGLYDLHEGALQGKPECAGFGQVRTIVLNPKAVTVGEFNGEFNEITHEWDDGLIPYYVKGMIEQSKEAIVASEDEQKQKGAIDKEMLYQTTQCALASQAAAAVKSIPIQHYKFTVVPGASLRNK